MTIRYVEDSQSTTPEVTGTPLKDVVAVFAAYKPCKSCIKYQASGKPSEVIIGDIYIPNSMVTRLGSPSSLKITIEPA